MTLRRAADTANPPANGARPVTKAELYMVRAENAVDAQTHNGYKTSGTAATNKTDANTLQRRDIQRLLRRYNLPGRLSGKGWDWTLEVNDEKEMKAVKQVLSGIGGTKVGWGGWVLRPAGNVVDKGDPNDVSSRHHYANEMAATLRRIDRLEAHVRKLRHR